MTVWCAVLWVLVGLAIGVGVMTVLWAASVVSGQGAEEDENLQER